MSDWHAHKCDKCGTVWEHDREVIGFGNENYRKAHTCPNGCATQFFRHFSNEIPQYCHNDSRTITYSDNMPRVRIGAYLLSPLSVSDFIQMIFH